ncbi:MAG: mechanosensitive ion channel family protein [Candidatus Omnitrophica bacterium]|nr:mechanosensitive ion channel family protein [Candidatus Omnitrophota bacterium]
MTAELFTQLPPWVLALASSLATVLVAWFIGKLAGGILCRRLEAWTANTAWQWDDLVIQALRRGIPIWSLLVGAYIATGFWSLPEHFQQVLGVLTYVLIWLSVTFVAAGLAGKLILVYSRQFQHALPVTSVTENIVKIIIIGLGALMILNGLGISITPLLTALGVGGLAVALALQDTLANLFAGLYLTLAREIRVGNYVKLETGQEGYVDDIGWRATRIRMLPNNMVLVPNKKLAEAIVTNFDLPSQELAVLVEVGVAYGSDMAKVERVTCDVGQEVMRQVTGGVPGFAPFIRFHTFGDFSVNFTVILRAKTFVDQYLVKHEFVKRLHDRYQLEGIEIPFPIRTVYTKTEVAE